MKVINKLDLGIEKDEDDEASNDRQTDTRTEGVSVRTLNRSTFFYLRRESD